MEEGIADVTLYRHPDFPGVIRVSIDGGEGGIFELDFQRFDYGDPVDVVENDWERLRTASEVKTDHLGNALIANRDVMDFE